MLPSLSTATPACKADRALPDCVRKGGGVLRSAPRAAEYVIGYMLILHGIVAYGFLLQGSMQCNGPPPALTQGKDRASKEFSSPCHRITVLRDAHSRTSHQPALPCCKCCTCADPRFYPPSPGLSDPAAAGRATEFPDNLPSALQGTGGWQLFYTAGASPCCF